MNERATIGVILEHQLFDYAYYLKHNPDIADQLSIDPLLHYLSHGGLEGRSPHPLFDSSFYMERNPDVDWQSTNPLVHYVTEGARAGKDPHCLFSTSFYLNQGLSMDQCSFNPLIHYLQVGAQQGFDPHPLFDGKFYGQQWENTGGEMLSGNPLVHYLTEGAKQGVSPSAAFDGSSYCSRNPDVAVAGVNPLVHFVSIGQAEGREGLSPGASYINPYFNSVLEQLKLAIEEPFTHLLVSSELVRGGSVRCASSFASAIASKVGLNNLVFLVTDYGPVSCADWLPTGTRVVNLLELEPSLSREDRGKLFFEILDCARPKVAINFNSTVFWKSLETADSEYKNRLSTKLAAYLGGYEDYVDLNCHGFIKGSIQNLVNDIDLFVTDNDRLRSAMIDRYHSEPGIENRIVTCYKSLTDDLLSALSVKRQSVFSEKSSGVRQSSQVGPTGTILWASRLDGMKQPGLLARIAEQLPNVKFNVYGRQCLGVDLGKLPDIANVVLCGEYSDFSAIPTHGVSAFLHTSNSDSMPHVLVEAAAAGLPIIAADIGAIGELIDESTGWLVSDCNDVASYVAVIKSLLDQPQQAKERTDRLVHLVEQRHNWPAFVARVNSLDIWSDRAETREKNGSLRAVKA